MTAGLLDPPSTFRSSHWGTIERGAPAAAGALVSLPVLLAAFPPASDLPYHEAQVGILRHLCDRTMFPVGLYQVNLGHPNQLFHLLSLVLSFALPVRIACRLVLAAAILLVSVGAGRLAGHVGAPRSVAFVVGPIAIGWLLFMGLVANIVGLGLLLALLPTLDRFVEAPTVTAVLKACGASVLLYLGHEAILFVFVAALLLIAAGHRTGSPRTLALRFAPAGFAGVLIAAPLRYQEHLFTAARNREVHFESTGAKVAGLPGCLFGAFDPWGSRVLFALAVAALTTFAFARVRSAQGASTRLPRSLRGILHHFRFEGLALVCAAGYLLAPSTLNGATLVYHRFLAPGFAIGAIACARRGRQRPATAARLPFLLSAAVPLATLLVLWPAFAESSRSVRELDALVPLIEDGSAIAVLPTARDYTGYARAPQAGLAVVERGGRLLFSFAESPIAPVMFRRETEWTDPLLRVSTDEFNFCPSWDFRRFRYLLVDSVDVEIQLLVALAIRPEGRFVASQGEWALYESTLPTVPVDARDEAAPSLCATDTVARRINAIADATAKERQENPPPPGTLVPRIVRIAPRPKG